MKVVFDRRGLVYLFTLAGFMSIITACATGPTVVGDHPPMIDQANAIVFSYELAKPDPVPEDTRPLGNTRWQVKSITPRPERSYSSMVYFFRPDGNLLETITYGDGSVKTETSRYHIIGSTMLINKRDGDVNARFKIEGDALVVDTGERSILLYRAK